MQPTHEELCRIEAEEKHKDLHDVDAMIAAASREEHSDVTDQALDDIFDVYSDIITDINYGVGDEETMKQNLYEFIREKALALHITFDNMFEMFVSRYAL